MPYGPTLWEDSALTNQCRAGERLPQTLSGQVKHRRARKQRPLNSGHYASPSGINQYRFAVNSGQTRKSQSSVRPPRRESYSKAVHTTADLKLNSLARKPRRWFGGTERESNSSRKTRSAGKRYSKSMNPRYSLLSSQCIPKISSTVEGKLEDHRRVPFKTLQAKGNCGECGKLGV